MKRPGQLGISYLHRVIVGVGLLRRSLFNASLLMIQPLLLNLIGVPALGYIIASLGDVAYGQWALALTVNATSVIITNMGLRSRFVRHIAQDPASAPSAFREQLGTRVLLAILAAAASISACLLLGYPRPVVAATAILSVGLVFTAMASCVADLLQAVDRLPVLASINMTAGLALTVLSVAVTYLDLGIPALCGAYVVGPVLACLLSLIFVHRRLFAVSILISPRRSLELLLEARVMGAQVFVSTLANQVENLLVPIFSGMATYGQFAAGTLLVRRLDIIPDALCTAFYPVMARAWHLGGGRSLRQLAFVPVALCLPAAIVIYIFAGPISRFLFPNNPEVSRFVIQVTVWLVPLVGLANGLGYALNAARRERQETVLLMSVTIVSLIFAPILIWRFGVVGACLSLLLRQAMGAVVRVPLFLSATATAASASDLVPMRSTSVAAKS